MPSVKDFIASIVVFLVALPLCMGVAVASGVPVASGLITGIVGGIIVGLFAGSPLQVSGPAAGLTVLIFELVQRLGLPALGFVVLIAGLIQLTAGAFRLGQWFRAVSPAVIHGMLAGIGVLIFSSQFHVLVDDKPRETGWKNLISIPEAIEKGLPIPKLDALENRRDRLVLMRKLELLHEQQEEVQESVAEHVSRKRTEAEATQQQSSLEAPAKRQEKLTSAIRELLDDAFVDQLLHHQQDAELLASFRQAVKANENALKEITAKNLNTVLDTQKEALDSLLQALRGLKSHDWAAKVGLMTILTLIFWELFLPKRYRNVPGPLIAIVLTTSLVEVLKLPVLTVELPDQLIDGIHFLAPTVLNDLAWKDLLISGFMIAVIASAETLLCATAVDQMHTGPRTKYDQELMAQGLGNTICGVLGALPMTGVVVRSAANVQAGAQSRWSAVFHGIWLLAFVVFLSSILRMVPTAALAGILVYTGYKLMSPKTFWHLWKTDRSEACIFLATVLTIVATDLLTGVIVGLVLAAVKLLYMFSALKVVVTQEGELTYSVSLVGAATFLRLPVLATNLEKLPKETSVRFDLSKLTFLDHACIELIEGWTKQHQMTGGQVQLSWSNLPGVSGNSSHPSHLKV